MAVLPKMLQLDILADFQLLPEDLEQVDRSRFGLIRRKKREIYRCHAGDYRIYFEKHPEGVLIHRVLHRNTLDDFLYRTNLQSHEEDEQVASSQGFWQLIEEADRAPAEKKSY